MNKLTSKLVTVLLIIIFTFLMVFLSSCCKECPVGPLQPKPYKGYLYASDWWQDRVYQIDIETDSVVDSLVVPTSSETTTVEGIDVSQDGRFLAVCWYEYVTTREYATYIYDAQTLDVITVIPRHLVPKFVSDENVLIGFSARRIFYYSLPDFNLIFEDSIGAFYNQVLVERQNLIYGINLKHPGTPDSISLVAYDYRQRQIVNDWHIEKDNGDWVFLGDYDIHPTKNIVYFRCSWSIPKGIVCYNLDSREVIYTIGMETHHGEISVSPDGQELYATDAGWGTMESTSNGTVFIFDANDGSYLHGISLFGYDPRPYCPLFARPVIFTPTGEKAYVGSGDLMGGLGTVTAINTDTREITKQILPELKHQIYQLVIGPKL